MQLPPAIIIHSLRDAQKALAPGLPVTLLSGPGAALYAGCLWWQSLLAAAHFSGPALLDCGQAPGRALEALALGLRGLVLRCPDPGFAQLAREAARHNALLLPAAPAALDLGQNGALRHIPLWLGGAEI